jgi:hypothetical protein
VLRAMVVCRHRRYLEGAGAEASSPFAISSCNAKSSRVAVKIFTFVFFHAVAKLVIRRNLGLRIYVCVAGERCGRGLTAYFRVQVPGSLCFAEADLMVFIYVLLLAYLRCSRYILKKCSK